MALKTFYYQYCARSVILNKTQNYINIYKYIYVSHWQQKESKRKATCLINDNYWSIGLCFTPNRPYFSHITAVTISFEFFKFPWRPSRDYSSSNSRVNSIWQTRETPVFNVSTLHVKIKHFMINVLCTIWVLINTSDLLHVMMHKLHSSFHQCKCDSEICL